MNSTRPFHNEPMDRVPAVTQPWHLPQLSVLITDSCALACEGCITFNNTALGGHRRADSQVLARLTAWSQIISVQRLYVIGGEPLGNPALPTWMATLSALWPRAALKTIVTNGESLHTRTEQVMQWLELGWDLEVSAHSSTAFERIHSWWHTLCEHTALPVQHRHCTAEAQVTDYYSDADGRPLIQIGLRDQFYVPTYTVTAQGHIEWQALQPAAAQHRACAASDCTHLVDGIMYSCPVQATLPTLAKRFTVLGTAGVIAAQHSGFDPLLPRGSVSTWLAQLNQPRSQCSLCSWPRRQLPLVDPYMKKIPLQRSTSPVGTPAIDLALPQSPVLDVLPLDSSSPEQ